MDFTLDSEQTALRDAVRALLKGYDAEHRREVVAQDPGFDEGMWGKLAEMGLLGLPFSEDDGGMGAGPVELSLVAEEIGRVVAPEPYVESVVMAGGLVAAAGTSRAEEGDPRRALRRRAGPRRRAARARGPLGPRRRRRDGVRREAHRRQGAGAGRSPRRPVRRLGRDVRRRRPVPGRARRRRRGDRLRHPRRHPRRQGRLRRRHRDSARRRLGRRRGGPRARRGRREDRLLPRVAGPDGVGDEADHRLPDHPQAVRDDPQPVPGAHLPGGGHVHLARADPQHRQLGEHGAGRPLLDRPPRSPRPPAGPSSR